MPIPIVVDTGDSSGPVAMQGPQAFDSPINGTSAEQMLQHNVYNSDGDKQDYWAEKYIENAFFAGYLKGRTESTFEPEGNVKRGELAKVLSDLITNDDEKNHKLEERIKELE